MIADAGSLAERAVLVTGAGGGIGSAISAAFVAVGANVVATDIDTNNLANTVERISGDGGKIRGIGCDITDEGDVARLAADIAGTEGALDVLVNNAGLFDLFATAADCTTETWSKVMAVNLTAPFFLSRAFLPGMVDRGSGAIVNVASICSFVGGSGGSPYTASKHGLLGLTRQMAHEFGPCGIRVNAVCPGVIATGMSMPLLNDASLSPETLDTLSRIPSRRLGEAEEVARVTVFLASDEASFIQGAAVPVDGGWLAV